MSASSPFTNRDVEEILKIVDRLPDVEVRLESADMKLHIRKLSGAAPSAAQAVAAFATEPAAASAIEQPAAAPAQQAPVNGSSPASDAAIEPGTVAIRAPMPGSFYRRPSPADPLFVEPGQHVQASDPVCLIEVMKLFNTVSAGISGTIVSVVAQDGEMVEEGDILFTVRGD